MSRLRKLSRRRTASPAPTATAEPVVYHEPDNSHPGQPRRLSRLRGFGSIVVVFVVAIAIAIVLTLFVFQQYQVDGPSMQPTLHNGNRLIVWKLPRTWARLTGHPYVPDRGDIVIFNEPSINDLTDSGSDQLIKRVIGLPGDHIVIKNDVITIYNKQHPHGFDPDKTLPYGATPAVADSTASTTCSGSYCNLVVPAGHIFVCGDNRTNSLDSRVFGTVPISQIIGKLVVRITPLNAIEKF